MIISYEFFNYCIFKCIIIYIFNIMLYIGCLQHWHAMAPSVIKKITQVSFTNKQVVSLIIQQQQYWWELAVGHKK